MHHRAATLDDLPVLAHLNRQLAEDEGHRNRLQSAEWFQRRMHGFLTGQYKAMIFGDGGNTVGYALFRESDDSVYLRQFFVCRDFRRRGYGREAMGLLKEHFWPRAKRITVGVLCRNESGYAFWKAVGFRDYAVELEMLAADEP